MAYDLARRYRDAVKAKNRAWERFVNRTGGRMFDWAPGDKRAYEEFIDCEADVDGIAHQLRKRGKAWIL
jgi:hypothetical protein